MEHSQLVGTHWSDHNTPLLLYPPTASYSDHRTPLE